MREARHAGDCLSSLNIVGEIPISSARLPES